MTGVSSDFLPKISIITVTYNASTLFEQTISSIASQSYSNIEFLVIDGKSSDNTTEIIQQYRDIIAYHVSEPDGGIYDAMNKGLQAATGDYVLFLNAGDYFCNDNSLENIMLSAPTSVDVLYGDIQLMGTNGSMRHHKALQFSQENLLKYGTGVLCHQAILVKRMHAPLYDTRYVYKGELNWYFDIFQKTPDLSYFHYNEPLVYYFLGGKGYCNFLRNRLEWYLLLIKRFGVGAVFNSHFLKFICRDFKNRYGFLRQ